MQPELKIHTAYGQKILVACPRGICMHLESLHKKLVLTFMIS